MLECPQHEPQLASRRLQQQWQVDVERTETHPVLAELPAGGLIEGANVVRDRLALENAEPFLEPEGNAACHAGEIFGCRKLDERLQTLADDLAHPGVEPRLHALLVGAGQIVVRQQHDLGLQRILARLEPRNLLVAPEHASVAREAERICPRGGHAARAHGEFLHQHVSRGIARGLAMDALRLGIGIGREAEALESPDVVVLDRDRAVGRDIGVHLVLVAQALHERARALVDEALRELLVERVRERVLDGARALLPMGRVLEPVGAVGNERPGADVGDTRRERVDIAIRAVIERDLIGEPVGRDALEGRHEELVERRDEIGVALRGDLAVVGHLADFPEPTDGRRSQRLRAHFRIGADGLEREDVVGHARTLQAHLTRRLAEAVAQPLEGREIDIAVSPLENFDAVE